MECRFSVFSMAMEVYLSFPFLIIIHLFIGNEVADYVNDYFIIELKQLASFKNMKLDQAGIDIYMKIDELLRTPAAKEKLKTYKTEKDPSSMLMGRGN